MPSPKLPTYSSPENSHFHPVFESVLNEIIIERKLTVKYEVLKQHHSATGPIDLVLFNKITKKVTLPIEIKRNQSSVRGIGRRQSRDYWVNLGVQCETPFYCVSNLELTELFRNDSSRPKTIAQKIIQNSPIPGILGTTAEGVFYKKLKVCLNELLDTILLKIGFKYASGLYEFQTKIQSLHSNYDAWHKFFMPTCFEYVRGAANEITNLRTTTKNWKDASFYHATPNRLSELGLKVNFEQVFKYPVPSTEDIESFNNCILQEANSSGKALSNGDDIAELVYEVLAPTSPGIVETDFELASLLAVVAKDALGSELNKDEVVFDPGSGSGRLLSVLPLVAFPSIAPKQVYANEKEKFFSEALSMRLGLTFASVLTPTNTPKITISPIENINKEDLKKVKVVVMNPPFISGILASELKHSFAKRIKEISGNDSITNNGQIALEALFLELVLNLVQTEVVIATIFPIQHLFRLSSEVKKLREFLVKDFGLTHIVIHPMSGLFENVIKQTVILVGKKSNKAKTIKLVEVEKKVSELDLAQLLKELKIGNPKLNQGVVIRSIQTAELLSSAKDGWKNIFGTSISADKFIYKYMKNFDVVADLKKNLRRGTIGNCGNTKLTVFDPVVPTYPSVVKLIPNDWLRPVLNTTEGLMRLLTQANAPEMSFLPPKTAYVNGTNENKILKIIVQEYIKVLAPATGIQPRETKALATIINDLKKDQKDFGAGWVLLQRASRVKGEVSMLESEGILLSTNVPMIKFAAKEERQLFASWLLSVFGQLQFERYSISQEGMRKMEIGSIKKIKFPVFSDIPKHIKDELINILPSEIALQFKKVLQRRTDILWANVLNHSSPNDCLNEAFEIFGNLVDERVGLGN